MMIDPSDTLISSISLYKGVHWSLHLNVLPFLCIYSGWMWVWAFYLGIQENFELGMIGFSCIGGIQLLLCLFCQWSVHVMAFVTSKGVSSTEEASVAKVVPTPNNGSSELVKVFKSGDEDVWIVFQKIKYIWDMEKKRFKQVEFPISQTLRHYFESKGYETEEELLKAKNIYNNNTVDMSIPDFQELFKERATMPFFVFQVFCVGLWCLDKYWYYSIFTLIMLVMFECTLVKQQIRNMSEIRKMGNQPSPIMVWRYNRWRTLSSEELVAGDIVSIGRSANESLIPCDLILMRGSCIVDESMLTGESIPQLKEPLENVTEIDREFEFEADGKLHVLFGGTKMIQHTPPVKNNSGLRANESGVVAYVARTGFNTSQGQLLRTILFGVRRVTANNLETFIFILFLLFFAIAAAAYVWVKGIEDPNRNRYRLFLECTLILTSVVPPELPIELSLAVNTSLISLAQLGIYCTEPFRIPHAGKVEICCFDKTGTLTSDNLVIEGVAGVNESDEVTPIDSLPTNTIQVLATCHSLAQLEDGMVGDPLERAVLNAINWTLTKGDAVIPKKGKFPGIKIFQRFHFSSALKRMAVLAGYQVQGSSENSYIASIKGAPEVIKSMFSNIPSNYDEVYLKHARRGARVLALGFKEMGKMNHQDIKNITRKDIECDLTFAGFVILTCPLKPDSKAVIKDVINASHRVCMITGDSALTACHVAKELKFTQHKEVLMLSKDKEQEWKWLNIHSDYGIKVDFSPSWKDWKEFVDNHDFCLTGEGLSYLLSKNPKYLFRIIPHVCVFARVSPSDKEQIITTFKSLNFTTLMCGDGTNDVGALKHAEVGVAILSSHSSQPTSSFKPKKEQSESEDDIKSKLEKFKRNTTPRKRGFDSRQERNHQTQHQIQKLLKEIEETDQIQVVKLGDASIAAPFTAKQSSISCIYHIIKQGRCTLVTTLQMFKILALNALILAYSQSVLYLEGVKLSDGQATLQGLLLAACFFFISRAKPPKSLSKQRPLPNIFNAYTVVTVVLQFLVHFGCLIYLVQQAYILEPRKDEFPDLEGEFEPNLLNSTVYMISLTLQVSTFAINYRGKPFMKPMSKNKDLLSCLIGTASFIAMLSLGWLPDLNEYFGIVAFPDNFRHMLIIVLLLDFLLSLLLDRICLLLFGEGKLRKPT
uniref:ATPase type 13A1 [Nasonia vitripennis] n=1 Tax=Lepeophtheirus salmonis TaxID=72036 RepID=A0A0K2ULY2_LEPSM